MSNLGKITRYSNLVNLHRDDGQPRPPTLLKNTSADASDGYCKPRANAELGQLDLTDHRRAPERRHFDDGRDIDFSPIVFLAGASIVALVLWGVGAALISAWTWVFPA